MLPGAFERALKHQKVARTHYGCIVSYRSIASIAYHRNWNKLRMLASNETEALRQDALLLRLDSLILVQPICEQQPSKKRATNSDSVLRAGGIFAEDDQPVEAATVTHLLSQVPESRCDPLLITRALENREYAPHYLPHIERLAFEGHNHDAVVYLHRYAAEGREDAITSACLKVLEHGVRYAGGDAELLEILMDVAQPSDINKGRDVVVAQIRAGSYNSTPALDSLLTVLGINLAGL